MLVLSDVKNDLISPEEAEKIYHVVIENNKINFEKTNLLRKNR